MGSDYISQAAPRGRRGCGIRTAVTLRSGEQPDTMAAWVERLTGVRGVLLDISGVLYDSGVGGGAAIAGSVEAVARLVSSTQRVPGLCRYRRRGVRGSPAFSSASPTP